MGVKIHGSFDELRLMMQQGGYRAERAARNEMARETVKIAELARQMAPVDKHNLEKAIQTDTDYGGTNGRKRFYVFVADEVNGVNVGRYAMVMHELLGVTYKLGPKSVAKQRANPGVMVGQKFLERALEERAEKMLHSVVEAVRGSLDGFGDFDE